MALQPFGQNGQLREAAQVLTPQHVDRADKELPPGAKVVILSTFFNAAFGQLVAMGLFDAFLLEVREAQGAGRSNTFVGALATTGGLVALAVVVPTGWLADMMPKYKLLRCNALVGLAVALLMAVAISSDSMPLLLLGAVLLMANTTCLMATGPALLTDISNAGDQRTRLLAYNGTAMSLGNAFGPLLQLSVILATGTSEWSASELHSALMVGVLPSIPAAILIFQIPASSVSGVTSRPGGSPQSGNQATAEDLPRVVWLIAILMELCQVTTAIGSGMTFKYWPLFYKNDLDCSPKWVCGLLAASWLVIALLATCAPRIAKTLGRVPTSLLFHYAATGMLYVISTVHMPAVPTASLVLVRNGLMNGNTPLQSAVVMDVVPKQHRGKWSSLMSLKRMMWSGSALMGGWLSDSHDYRFAFFVTACVHMVSGAFMFPLVSFLKSMGLQS